jgi:hypothetical protein
MCCTSLRANGSGAPRHQRDEDALLPDDVAAVGRLCGRHDGQAESEEGDR